MNGMRLLKLCLSLHVIFSNSLSAIFVCFPGVLGPLQLLSDAMDSSSELQPLVRTSIAAAEVLLATINNMLVRIRHFFFF